MDAVAVRVDPVFSQVTSTPMLTTPGTFGSRCGAVSTTFSVVTPSFRAGPWLRLCIASVADQGVPVQHIVQDAGSDDGTLDWLRGDARVELHEERDAGMYDGVNRGLRRARGEVVSYLNCDEQYLPGALSAVAEYFGAHPEVDVVFADAVVVDRAGEYLWHRKALVPGRLHTKLFPLSVLSCAMFLRRRLLEERRLEFDSSYRYCGDGAFVRELHRLGVRMGAMRRFTSVFTHTGQNLSLRPEVRTEAAAYFARVRRGWRLLKPLVWAWHRVRRWWGGVYHQEPFGFSLYTLGSPDRRVERFAAKPTYRWRW